MAVPRLPNWQQYILNKVGAPVTSENLKYINAWARAEGGNASNNPFNTTQPGYHTTGNYNSVGVKNYGDPRSGLDATVHTLLNGRYGNILGSLRRGNSAMADANALANSPWGTGGLVQKILGGGGAITAPQAPAASAASGSSVGGDPSSARNSALMQYALAQSNALLKGDTSGSTDALLGMLQAVPSEATTTSTAKGSYAPNLPVGSTLSKNISGKLKLSPVPGQFDTRAGIQVNASIMPSVLNIARNFGVKVNSGYRSPEHNAAVGGASHSDHLSGNAVDFTGSPDAMHRLYNWAQGRFPYVEPWDQAHGDHVHISFIR